MKTKMNREYPHLQFHKNWSLSSSGWLLMGQCEAYVAAIDYTPIMPDHYHKLKNVSLLKGAQATTAIEGNTLSDEEVKNIMNGHKLPPSKEYQEIEVNNILAALNGIFDEVVVDDKDQYISSALIKQLHKMVGKDLGEHFGAIPGKFRENDVYVGTYRCPDYRDVPGLVNQLCEWLKEEFMYKKKKQSFSDILIQAIVSHLFLEWIHPFGDGNGRTGRLVEFYILVRGGIPDIASHILSNYYNQTRPEYYRQIEKARERNDLTNFIEYGLLGFRDGLKQTLEIIQESQIQNTWQRLIFDRFDEIRQGMNEDVFKRQRTLALQFPTDRGLTIGEIPELSVPLAKIYAGYSEKTVSRDVEKLIDMEILIKSEDKYKANIRIIRQMCAQKRLSFNN